MTKATESGTSNAILNARKRAPSFDDFCESMLGADWREPGGLWATLTAQGSRNANMIVLEQRTIRSHRLRECIRCGDTATVTARPGGLIKCVPDYYMCAECDAYYEGDSSSNRRDDCVDCDFPSIGHEEVTS